MYSSDQVPPTSVEQMYVKVFQDENWNIPTVAAASAGKGIAGKTGVKMSGPYAYVLPEYWSASQALNNDLGGAFGFNTETSIGAAVMPVESFERTTTNESKRWPVTDNEAWSYHAGASTGSFHGLMHFTPYMNHRLGESSNYEEYTERAQLMVYEGHRAMFEAYSASKYNATGVVQWMLNSAFPSHVWHLYDWFLNPAGAYFGAKKALETVHIQWDYSKSSVVLVNSEYEAKGPFKASAELFDLTGDQMDQKTHSVNTIAADTPQELFSWPLPTSTSSPRILRLKLTDSASGSVVSNNVYWLSSTMDVVDWNKCNWYHCKGKTYADFTELTSMPQPTLDKVISTKEDGAWSEVTVTLRNTGSNVAFFTRLRLLKLDGQDVLPVQWSDNYVTLFAGETLKLTAKFRSKDGPFHKLHVAPFGSLSGDLQNKLV